jgi:hypothetical protein
VNWDAIFERKGGTRTFAADMKAMGAYTKNCNSPHKKDVDYRVNGSLHAVSGTQTAGSKYSI